MKGEDGEEKKRERKKSERKSSKKSKESSKAKGSISKGAGMGLKLPTGNNAGAKKMGLSIKVEEKKANPEDSYKFVAAASVKGHAIVEEGTERKESIPESTRDRIRYFNQICSKVTEHLYLGSDFVARDLKQLKECKITHVLNCAGTVCNDYYPEEFTYKTLHLLDGKQEDARCVFMDVMEFIHKAVQEEGRVFVHCQQGISRSSTMLICYLLYIWRKPAIIIHEEVKTLRNISSPNAGFMAQLLDFDRVISADIAVRPTEFYMVIPHNLCAPDVFPLKLVKKNTSVIDKRVPYLLSTPKTLYVVMNDDVHPALKEHAEMYVKNLQMFLKVSENVVHLTHDNKERAYYSELGVKEDEDIPTISTVASMDTQLSLMTLFDQKSKPFQEEVKHKESVPKVFKYSCFWSEISPTKEDVDRLKSPENIFAILDHKDKHLVYLWIGDLYKPFQSDEINNLGLQFLTRQQIFMTTSDYVITQVRQGKEKEIEGFEELFNSVLL
mmetsp:Transcript_22966/g.35755  ORF Transcript_22966/g.35755 Transcript_22966/m.35755 type:complete len:497 (-) Transcript_22966:42-1532(-)